MNKPISGKRMTIKINGEKSPSIKLKKEPPKAADVLEQQEYVSEKEKKATMVETAATQETEESFDWILPEQDTAQNELALNQPAKNSKQRKGIRLPALSNVEKKNVGSLKSIAISALFAVLLGTGFGVVMLKLVIPDNNKPLAVAKKAGPSTEIGTTKKDLGSMAVVTIKPFTVNMVQAGVYTKKETAQKITNQIIKKGIPADMMTWQGKYYIFLGIADSLENAKGLGKMYENNGMDTLFSKNITIPEKQLSKITVSEKNVMEDAIAAVPVLINLTSKALNGEKMAIIDLNSLSKLNTKLTGIDNKKMGNKQINDLKLEITGAIKQINEYQRNKDRHLLEKAQQHLLTFLSLYYSL